MTAIIGWALAVASTATVLPQSIKLLRSRNSEGVSTVTVALASVTMAVWSTYTFQLRDWPALGSSLGPLLAWGGSLVLLSIINKSRRIMIVAVGISALVLPFLSLTLLGILAAAGSTLWALPQLKVALSKVPLTGVSALAYIFIAIENVGWIVYGLLTGHLIYLVAPLVQAPVALIIAIKARKDKQAARARL
jgi:uncharacterized protein with PQ loop repeat